MGALGSVQSWCFGLSAVLSGCIVVMVGVFPVFRFGGFRGLD